MNRSHLTAWVLTISSMSALCAQPSVAQVVTDNTLPVGERSQVSGNANVQIDGGARRGSNLFHSFSQFSIPTGGSAFFNNAADVRNIFSRITGGSVSNIDGLIRANGTVNLFLLNPNGILFGPNASLNIGGSFVATTANAIGFPNGEVFSSDATQPLPSQLLTVNPNAFFFNQLIPKPIINQSTANGTGLQVPARQNLMLVGGAVQLENGRLTSPGSYVELGGVGGIGTVSLATAGEDWQLTIPDTVPRADVFLRNGGHIVVGSPALSRNIGGIIVIGDSGSIRILGHNIDLLGSSLWVEIPSSLRLPDTRTGGIDLNATGSIAISDSVVANRLFGQGTMGSITLTAGDRVTFANNSRLYNTVDTGGVGNTGGLSITTGSLSLIEGAELISGTRGLGNTGNVNINARDTVSLDGIRDGYRTSIFNIVDPAGTGNAGNITITTGSLSLTAGGGLQTSTFGQGNAGSVTIYAHDTVSLDDGIVSATVTPTGIGNAGNITLTTGSLSLTEGSALFSLTQGQGDAGSVTINARNTTSFNGSDVFTSVADTGIGNAGNITLTTGSLYLTRGAELVSSTFGQGDAGSVTIHARDAVFLDGVDENGYASGVFTNVISTGIGNAGNITLTTGSLSLTRGAALVSSTAGTGNAGNITASADTVALRSGGQLLTTTFSSGRAGDITVNTPTLQLAGANTGLFAQTTSTEDAGNLTIQPRDNGQSVRVNLQDGAQVSASTFSSGRGGELTIAAPDSITLTGNGSVIAAGTDGSGNGGNLNLRTRNLNIQNQAEVTVSSAGTGSAGSLFVDADRIFLNNQGSIRADTTGGGGNINLRSPFILLRNGSNITTNATGANIPGGNIAIDTRFLIAVTKEDSNISANSEDFRGGNVRINAFSIFGIQPRSNATPLSDITATGATSALSGTIDVITSGLDPTSGLVALPTDLVDSSGLIAQGCPANQGNSFVITGRGGLPPTPEQQLDDDAEWSDRRRLTVAQPVSDGRGIRSQALKLLVPQAKQEPMTLEGVSMHSELKIPSNTPHPTPHTLITEATGWQITSTGDVFLVASTPDPTVQNRLNQAVTCQGR